MQSVRAFELFEKYRRRMVDEETGLPFEPTSRARPWTIEGLAFETAFGLRLVLRLFFPFCATLFLVSFLWDFQGLVRSCAVAGMIGFGTNWIAIKMLFWPRQTRPIFGQGLIPSQREQLIDKVADEVLNNLINEELILRKIEETGIINKFSGAIIEKLRVIAQDPEFKRDLRNMVLTYVGEIAANPEFRLEVTRRAEGALEEFGGSGLRSWVVRKLKDVWRPPLIKAINAEIEDLEQTVDGAIGGMDEVFERLPRAIEDRQAEVDKVLTTMLVGFVREVDVRAIVLEQLSTVTTEQLEKGFREFSDDKLSFITLLGGIFGLIGGTVLVWPIPSIAVLAGGLAVLALLDIAIHPLMRSRWWPQSRRQRKRP